MREPRPHEWLALCLITESDQPHEWHSIAWAVRNRMLDRRYPDTVAGVVLQPWQFSHFNDFALQIERAGPARTLYDDVVNGEGDTRRVRALSEPLLGLAQFAAEDFLAEPLWRRPFGPTVCHYYSPVSMRPRGSTPAWARDAKRLFTPSGVDPERFVFAEGVP